MSEKYRQAYIYADLSRQFCDVYGAYSAYYPDVMDSSEVQLFLVCHALELALKGWILLREDNQTPEKLRHKYGHNLSMLARDAKQYYDPITVYLPLIEDLNVSYKAKLYDYPDIKDNGVKVPVDLDSLATFASRCRFDLDAVHQAWIKQGMSQASGEPQP